MSSSPVNTHYFIDRFFLSVSFGRPAVAYDMLLGSIAAFYVFMVPYNKVEESFNVQYDHLEFPGGSRTFIVMLFLFLS
ncbi:hypothetical protein SLE2022_172050 [Rubroshorea leprosula]